MKEILKLNGKRIMKYGNSYHVVIGSAYVEGADILKSNKEYDVVFVERENNNGSSPFQTPNLSYYTSAGCCA